jgi:uncharacterized protein YbcI
MTSRRTVDPVQDGNATAGAATAAAAESARLSDGHRRQQRDASEGTAAMAICNAMVGALKRLCGKGPTKVKAYGRDDHVAVVTRDTLTTLERTLVRSGHEQLVREARTVLTDEVVKECRETIEQATGRRIVGWESQVNPSADRAIALVWLQPLARAADRPAGPEAARAPG